MSFFLIIEQLLQVLALTLHSIEAFSNVFEICSQLFIFELDVVVELLVV